jgi:putative nucleotidyltransferase with HDIG domain
MMRAVRFGAQLNFDIEADAFEAMKAQADRLQIVSMERIMTEFNKTLLAPYPSYRLKLAYFSGLLQQFFPELVALAGAENLEGKTHKDNFFHTLEVLENFCEAGGDLWLRWAALLHDIAKPATKRFDKKVGWTFHGHEDKGARWVPAIFRRLKLPLDQKMKRVQNLVRMHLRPIALSKEVTDSAVRRLMAEAGEDLHDLMVLVRADVTTKNPNKAKRYLANFDAVEAKMALVEESDKVRNFQPVLTGDVIMAATGLKPGKEVGILKTAIREGILDGRVKNTWADCWAELEKLAAGMGLTLTAIEEPNPDEASNSTV